MVPARYEETRQALHAVAEHVLAAGRYVAVGRIGLVVAPGGFATPEFDGRVLQVDGVDLVVTEAGGRRRSPLTTLGAAARFAGIEPGMPASVYPPATRLDLDRRLAIDAEAAAALAGWLALADEALRTFAASASTADAASSTEPTLWPEHFDLSLTLDEVNYGASPGDADLPEPYAYVGPWARPLPGDAGFWNQPFGAARAHDAFDGVAGLVAFFAAGLAATRAG